MTKGDVYKIYGYRVVDAESDGTTAIEEGDIVVFSGGKVKKPGGTVTAKVGVAKATVASGSTSQLPVLVEGVVEVPKPTGTAMTMGTFVYVDGNQVKPVAADMDPRQIAGYVEADAAAADTTVVIRLR